MRKIAILLTAAFALLLVGMLSFQADAMVGTGAHSLLLVTKDYSPVEKMACQFTAVCGAGRTLVCRPFWRYWCARCR
jgi:hypothetical protein